LIAMAECVKLERTVKVRYVMRSHLPDGTVKEHSPEEMEFIFGVERQVPTLERALGTACVGDRLALHIPPSEIYGDHDPGLIREIPKKGLIKQRLREGQLYRQIKGGGLISFKVLEIRPATVIVDLNRPLAGISVSMDLEVLAVKKATRHEINAAYDAQVKKTIGCG
jgi:FKBP-type peptidyl-prolyl cis-trans isomerase SlyD